MKTNIINYYNLPIIKVDNVTVKDLNSSFVYINKSRYLPVAEFLTNKIPSINILECIIVADELWVEVKSISIKDIKNISNIFSTTNLEIKSYHSYYSPASITIIIKL